LPGQAQNLDVTKTRCAAELGGVESAPAACRRATELAWCARTKFDAVLQTARTTFDRCAEVCPEPRKLADILPTFAFERRQNRTISSKLHHSSAVSSEILMIGDAARRLDLISKVRDCGYEVMLADSRDVMTHLRQSASSLPVAIVVCMDDVPAAELLASLRRSREGANIPVLLHAALRNDRYNLADLLDLGADHIVVEPVDFAGLRQALLELAGPPANSSVEAAGRPREEPADSGLWEGAGQLGGPGTAELEVEERVVTHPGSANVGADPGDSGDRFEIELASMGMEVIPDVEPEGDTLEADDPQTHLGLEPNARATFARAHRGAPRSPAETAPLNVETLARSGHQGENDTRILKAPRIDARTEDDLSRLRAGSGAGGTLERGLQLAAGGQRSESGQGLEREAFARTSIVDQTREESGGRAKLESALPFEYGGLGTAGRIVDLELARLIWWLHQRAYDGILELAGPSGLRRLVWQHGQLVGASSTAASDRVSSILAAKGWLTRQQSESLQIYESALNSNHEAIVRLIARQGLLKPREIAMASEVILLHVIGSALNSTQGTWRLLAPDWQVESSNLHLPPLRALVVFVLRYAEAGQLALWLQAFELTPYWRTDDPQATLDHLAGLAGVPANKLQWLLACDGLTPLSELNKDNDPASLAWCYLLHVIGAIELPLHSGSDQSIDAIEIDHLRINERLHLAREGNYFALLGLAPGASEAEIRRAGHELSELFSPPLIEPESALRFSAQLHEIRAAIHAAAELLSEENLRRAYGAHWSAN
jgi:CheY-like chemotaxis protein